MYQDIICAELALWQPKLTKLALDIWENPEGPNAEFKACQWTAALLQEAAKAAFREKTGGAPYVSLYPSDYHLPT